MYRVSLTVDRSIVAVGAVFANIARMTVAWRSHGAFAPPFQVPCFFRRRTRLARRSATSRGGSTQTWRRWWRWALRSFPTGASALRQSSSRLGTYACIRRDRSLAWMRCSFAIRLRFGVLFKLFLGVAVSPHVHGAVTDWCGVRPHQEEPGARPTSFPASCWLFETGAALCCVYSGGPSNPCPKRSCREVPNPRILSLLAPPSSSIRGSTYLQAHEPVRLSQVSGWTVEQERSRPSRRKVHPGRRGRRGAVHGLLLQHRLRVPGGCY